MGRYSNFALVHTVFKKLGLKPDEYTTSLDRRKVLQKYMYLIVELFNIENDLDYNWYVHGVYSSNLAAVYYKLSSYSNIGEIAVREENFQLSNEMNQNISSIQTWVESKTTRDNYLDSLVLITTVLHVKKENNFDDFEEIFNRVKELKPNLTGINFKRLGKEFFDLYLSN